jgi:hypothetical protein
MPGFQEKILPFGEYFSTTLKVGTKKFGKLFVAFLFWILLLLIVTAICAAIVAVVAVPYLPEQLVDNPQMLLSLTAADQTYLFSLLQPVLPFLIGALLLYVFLCTIAMNVFFTSVYLITEAHIKGIKRSMGSIIGYAFKRSIPLIGTSIWLSLFYLLITAIFAALLFIVLLPSAIDISSLTTMTFEQVVSIMAEWQFVVTIVLYVVFMFFCFFYMMMYYFSIFFRIKYKAHGMKSMKMSRNITKKKKGKLFGNFLLFTLIVGVINGILTAAAAFMVQNNMFYVHYVVALLMFLLCFFVLPYSSVVFVNFDMARGPHLVSSMNPMPKCIQDEYFARRDQHILPPQGYGGASQMSLKQASPVDEIVEQLEMEFDNLAEEDVKRKE